LGELYIQERRYDDAKSLYSNVLKSLDLDWAQVGLANSDLERGNVNDAVGALDHIVESYPSYLKAYDCLSKAYTHLGDSDKLQAVLEQAAVISPMSIGRQKILADTALANGDVEIAMNAYKKTIKYGANSHYDNVDNHLNLARAITKIYDNDTEKGQDFSLEAAKLLGGIDHKYAISDEQKIQAKLLDSQINAMYGNKRASEELCIEAQKLIGERSERDIHTEVESVNALLATGNVMQAKTSLMEMLEYYKDDQAALEKIDPLLEEPASEKGKKLIGSINKKGIEYYSSGEFEQAIAYFFKAQKRYPRYVGLKLNLIQAMISDLRENGFNQDHIDKCNITFKVVARYVTSDSDKYTRYKKLELMYRQVAMQVKHEAKQKAHQESMNE
jgi:tetratricopeptide (TPR) repeat protein